MMAFSIVFFANNLSQVYTRLVNRGWLVQDADGTYIETMSHLDIVELPVQVASSPGTLNPDGSLASVTMYPQRMLILRVSYTREQDETSEDTQTNADGTLRDITVRTKIGKWIVANSTAVTLTGYIGPTYQQQISLPARKMTGVNIWLMREREAADFLHQWQ